MQNELLGGNIEVVVRMRHEALQRDFARVRQMAELRAQRAPRQAAARTFRGRLMGLMWLLFGP